MQESDVKKLVSRCRWVAKDMADLAVEIAQLNLRKGRILHDASIDLLKWSNDFGISSDNNSND